MSPSDYGKIDKQGAGIRLLLFALHTSVREWLTDVQK